MRKIKSAVDIERVRKRNNIILGLVMIFLLMASIGGYSIMSASGGDTTNKVSELGFDFVRDQGLWKLAIGDDVFGFQYLPSEVEDVETDVGVELGVYSGQVLYFVNPGQGESEILNNIGRYTLRSQYACFDAGEDNSTVNGSENSCPEGLPTRDCSSNLIVFEAGGNSTEVYSEGNCVFISGDVVRGSDAFLYKVLGIN